MKNFYFYFDVEQVRDFDGETNKYLNHLSTTKKSFAEAKDGSRFFIFSHSEGKMHFHGVFVTSGILFNSHDKLSDYLSVEGITASKRNNEARKNIFYIVANKLNSYKYIPKGKQKISFEQMRNEIRFQDGSNKQWKYSDKPEAIRMIVKDSRVLDDLSAEYLMSYFDLSVQFMEVNNEDDSVYDDIESLGRVTDRKAQILARLGQGIFRKNVIKAWGGKKKCAVTGIEIPELLIASHVIPWADPEHKDKRLDGSNGILVLANIDKLFDNYLMTIVFNEEKNVFELKLSNNLRSSDREYLGLKDGMELIGKIHFSEREKFRNNLKHHNKLFESLRS